MLALDYQTGKGNDFVWNSGPMSTFANYEQIERSLLHQLEATRISFKAGRCGVDQYAGALKRFNDFILNGDVPGDWQDTL